MAGFTEQKLMNAAGLWRGGASALVLASALCWVWPMDVHGQAIGAPGSGAANISGKSPSKAGTSGPAGKPAGTHRRRGAKTAAIPAAATEVNPAVPVAPPAPVWPVNSKAERAQVSWDGRQLHIAATNSSLQQILRDVSTATGLKVEGLGSVQGAAAEQRIYGTYGPAPARDVLSSLLDGSGYNVLMIGDQGEGTPRELVLTSKRGGTAPVAAQPQPEGGDEMLANDDEAPEDPEPPEQQEQPAAQRPYGMLPRAPGAQNPQEMLQEIQQRQQQMQQQLMNQVNQQPPPDPQPEQ